MGRSFDPASEAAAEQFDRVAEDYDAMHRSNIAASGEGPEYFARYKLRVLMDRLEGRTSRPVLDFGCGIGNLTRLLDEALPDVHAYDPSQACVDVAKRSAARTTFYADLDEIPKEKFGAVVLANVLHHVEPNERESLVQRVGERLAPGGRLVVFEHNPLNPLTRRAVATCPFDEGVQLLWPGEVRGLMNAAGLRSNRVRYIVFFPHALRAFRRIEPRLGALPLGAQYVAWAEK